MGTPRIAPASGRTWLVVLRQRSGHPWEGNERCLPIRLITADTPDLAVAQAFDPPPSTLLVHDAFVVELAEPYMPYSVPLNVPKPEWLPAVPARPGDREAAARLKDGRN